MSPRCRESIIWEGDWASAFSEFNELAMDFCESDREAVVNAGVLVLGL